jgi:hypothetical protein
MRDTPEVTVTWFWLNIPPAVLFFLAWTLIPLRMVFRHPDTVPGVPARDEPPPDRTAATMAGSASGQPGPASTQSNPCQRRQHDSLAGTLSRRDYR